MAIVDGDENAGAQAHKLDNLNSLQDLFQVVGFVSAAQKAGKANLVKKNKASGTGAFGLDDLLIFSHEPLPASLLKLKPDNVVRAIQMFASILSYLGDSTEKLNDAQRVEVVQKLLHQGLKRPELKDELYMQLLKQTRGNAGSESRLKAWELFHLVAATMPPSKDFIGMVSSYVSARAVDDSELPHIQKVAARSWNCLKRTTRAGARRMLPSNEEIIACTKDTKLSTIVFFVDDTFDNLEYDSTTTVQEASGILAASIKLEHYKSFSLCECRRVTPPGATEVIEDQYALLDNNSYIADILVDLKLKNDKNGKDATNKLVFKKRMFRKDDEEIEEFQFVSLAYIQCQHDFVQGHYPVVKEDAAQMCALQMCAEHASAMQDDDEGVMMCIDKYVTKQILMTRPKDDWKSDISTRYKALANNSKDEARTKFLKLLRSLPYGLSTFFPVRRVEDPIGLLPPKLVIGVNHRGLHFFRPTPKEYLHSAELKDILQFGSSSSALFLKLKVADVPHLFQFETRQGQELCFMLQTHINDIMAKRFQKAKADRGESDEAERGLNKNRSAKGGYEQHLTQLQRALEDSQNLADQLQKNSDETRYAKEKLLAEIVDTRAALKQEEEARTELQEQAKALESMIQVNKEEIELNRAKASAAENAAAAAGAELASIDVARFAQLEELLVERSAQVVKMGDKKSEIEKRVIVMSKEKDVLDAKLKRIENSMEAENKELREKLDGATGSNKKEMQEKDAKLNELAEELAVAQNALNAAEAEIARFKSDGRKMEMQEILEMQADVERKQKQNAHILEDQAKRIQDVEKMCRDETLRRKNLFNQLEDIRGKLRVYCRVRPLLASEKEMGITFPSDQVVRLGQRDFSFDSVFAPDNSQEQVFIDTKHCVQSTTEGLNVTLFTIGTPGSGKSFSMMGSKSDPGLGPRSATELFRITTKSKLGYKVWFNAVALNGDTLVDLLLPPAKRGKPTKLDIKKDMRNMVMVAGATLVEIRDAEHLTKVMEYGQKAHELLKGSHMFMNIIVESTHATSGVVCRGKLTLVDMAGFEKGKSNKNIAALDAVIVALNDEAQVVPYRDSKLTMLLSDALGGTAKSVLMVHCSPAESCAQETAYIFDIAQRITKVKNVIKKVEETKDVQKLVSQVTYWMNQAGVPDKESLKAWAALDEIECAREVDENQH